MNNSNHKVLPHNLEAEQSIIEGILLENSYINSALEILSKGDFCNEAHRNIFSTIIELSENGQPFDLSTLTTALKDKGLLDLVGGISYLSSLVKNIPSAVNVGKYAEIVKNSAGLRKLIRAAEKIINDSKVTNANIYVVLDKAEQSIFKIRSVYDSKHC